MDATFEQLGSSLVIAVAGRLDTVSAPQFDQRVAPALAQPHARILLDLSGVSYISSAGLRSILQLVKHEADHGGRVGLFSVPAPIMDVIGISGFQSRLDLYPDRASALKPKAS
jgi:anti-sigma B factor antagonist